MEFVDSRGTNGLGIPYFRQLRTPNIRVCKPWNVRPDIRRNRTCQIEVVHEVVRGDRSKARIVVNSHGSFVVSQMLGEGRSKSIESLLRRGRRVHGRKEGEKFRGKAKNCPTWNDPVGEN